MRNVKWLVATGLVAVTAGCVESSGYPNSSYNNNNRGYYGSDGRYYSNTNSTASSSNPFYSPSAQRAAQQPNRDSDRDGVPNRYDRDANGDGIPDSFQR